MDITGLAGRSKKIVGNADNTIESFDAVVETSAVFQKRIKQSCNETLTSREELAKFFFQLLEYTSPFASKPKSCSVEHEAKQRQKRNYINGAAVG